jgi:hypothetical protein
MKIRLDVYKHRHKNMCRFNKQKIKSWGEDYESAVFGPDSNEREGFKLKL